MDTEIIVLSSDAESSTDIVTETRECSESEPDDETKGTHHVSGTGKQSEIEKIEADVESDYEDEITTDVENVGIAEANTSDDAIVRTVAACPAFPEAGDAANWASLLEALSVPVVMPIGHHVCSQCCLLFAHPWDLTRHMVTHVGEDSQPCSHCLEKFKDVLLLELHTASVHQEIVETDVKVDTDHEGEAQQKFDILGDLRQIDEYTEKLADIKIEIPAQNEKSMQQEKIHLCFQCVKSYGSPWELTRHQISHAGEPLHKCSHCGMYFPNPDQLVEHVKTHQEERSLQRIIEIEDEPQPQRKEVVINKKSYQCVYCYEVYDNISSLNEHIKYFHKCPKCSKMLANIAKRHVHIQTHKAVKSYRCSHCKVKHFKTKLQLKNHLKNCHECSQSGRKLSDKFGFDQHMFSRVENRRPQVKRMARTLKFTIDTSNRSHACCQCDLLFCCPYDLTRHMMSHLAPTCQSCPYCRRMFRDKRSLNQHIAAIHSVYSHGATSLDTTGVQVPKTERDEKTENVKLTATLDAIHADLNQIDEYTETRTDVKVEIKQEKKLHKCFQCRNCYVIPWDLTRHRISHIGQTLITCAECGLRLTDAASLQDHIKKHVKPSFLCPNCPKEFTVETHFDTHMAVHAQDIMSASDDSVHKGVRKQRSLQSYECTVCEAVFNYAHEYISHIMAHSKDKAKQDQSRQKSSTSHQLHKYKTTQANVGDLAEDYCHSLKQSVLGGTIQDEMNRDLSMVECLAQTKQTSNVTPNADEYLSITGGSIRMIKYSNQAILPPIVSSAQTKQNQYLSLATHNFSSSSQRSRNVKLVQPLMSNVVPATTKLNLTSTCTSIPSTRGSEEPTMNPHMVQMYQPSTSSVNLARTNQNHMLGHNVSDTYSPTVASEQTEMDRRMIYQVIQPTISSTSSPAAKHHAHTNSSAYSHPARGANQHDTNRNIQAMQPMSSFDDFVVTFATIESLAAARRQSEVSRITQLIQPVQPNVGNTGLLQSRNYSNMVQEIQPMSLGVGLAARDSYKCSQCCERFYSRADRDQHFQLHTSGKHSYIDLTEDEILHKCTHCHNTFCTLDELKNHNDAIHDRSHDASSSDFVDLTEETEKPHQCPICGQRFAIIWDVENHMTSHAMLGPQACFICKSWFDTSVQLRKHQATHRKEKSKTSPGSRTEIHAPSHSSNKENHKRSSVDSTGNSLSSDELIKHRRLYSDDKPSTMTPNRASLFTKLPHICYICGLGFSHPHTLRDHMVSHPAELPQSCSVCLQWFSTSADLIQHQMMHH